MWGMRQFITAISLLSIGIVGTITASDTPDGESLFKAQKCIMCHKYQAPDPTIEVVEGGPPNLWDVGDRRSAEWIIPFVKKESDIDGRKHKVIWKGKPEDLVIVANWLATLKSPTTKVPDTTRSESPVIPIIESISE